MDEIDATNLATMVLAAGALGIAAFGIVDGMKAAGLTIVGFRKITETLGDVVMGAIEAAYGRDGRSFLEALYRKDRIKGDLGKTLRQGLRVGLTPDNALTLAQEFGVVNGEALQAAARKLHAGEDLEDQERGIVGRFELAADARIDAALALSDVSYTATMRIAASFVAIILALIAALTLPGQLRANTARALLVGLAAIPLAPIAKDVAAGFKQARSAVGTKL